MFPTLFHSVTMSQQKCSYNNVVGILVEFNFEDAEVIYPYYRLQEAGYRTVLIGPVAGQQYKGKHGYPVKADVSYDNISAQDLCGLVVPGGFAPDYWRRNQTILQLVRNIDEQGKPLGSICHGPWVLISAKILKGRKATCFFAIKDDVENAGAIYSDEAVVIDGNLVTSRTPNDLPEFSKALLNLLSKQTATKQ